MHNITNSVELKRAIELLQIEQSEKAQSLRGEFNLALDLVKPARVFRNTLAISTTGIVIENLIRATTGIAVGYLTRKFLFNASGNVFKKLLSTVIQVGVTKAVVQHTNEIKSIGEYIFHRIFQSKKK